MSYSDALRHGFSSNTLEHVRRELAGDPHFDLVFRLKFVLWSSPDTSYKLTVRVADLAVIAPFRIAVPLFLLEAARHVLVSLRIAPNKHTALKTRHVHLNFITVPLLSVLVLLASGVFTGRTVRDGIVGTSGIQPLNIMALFISLVRT